LNIDAPLANFDNANVSRRLLTLNRLPMKIAQLRIQSSGFIVNAQLHCSGATCVSQLRSDACHRFWAENCFDRR
jgi:hypothetical protein